MIFEGAILDADGPRRGYLRLEHGRIVETGQIGTDSTRGRLRRVRGIALPPAVDGHTHLGDAGFGREPPQGPVSRVVAAPRGVKFRYLAETSPAAKRAGMRRALSTLAREGTALAIDFREEGVEGARALRRAARGLPVELRILGRPLRRPIDPAEIEALLAVADGLAMSSAREEDPTSLRQLARAAHRQGKWFALHASEVVREDPDTYLDPRPDLLVHLLRARSADLVRVAEARVPVAICPRSNALFGHLPDLRALDRAGLTYLLGTDNGMFASPSVFRELEFTYTALRLRHAPVPPERLLRAAFLDPWRILGRPLGARLDERNPGAPLLLRLPETDPAYQVVARASEAVILRPDSGRSPGVPP